MIPEFKDMTEAEKEDWAVMCHSFQENGGDMYEELENVRTGKQSCYRVTLKKP